MSQSKLVCGINCCGTNPILEFEAAKAPDGKIDGIDFYQYVQSVKLTQNITPRHVQKSVKKEGNEIYVNGPFKFQFIALFTYPFVGRAHEPACHLTVC